MRNAVVVSILWMLLSIPLPGQPRPIQQPANTEGTESQRDQRGSKDSPVFVDILQHPQSEADAAKIEKSTQHKETVDLVTTWAAGLAALFTGVLVVVGWRGVRAAVNTLKAIKEQGDYMKRQAVLMEVPLNQWVELENWSSESLTDNWFRIRVDLTNPTNFPVRVKSGILRINQDGGGVKHLIGEGRFLAPKKPHKLLIDFPIAGDQAAQFGNNGTLMFSVAGEFTHTGPLGEEYVVVQPVGGTLMCKIAKTEFTESVHMNPTPAPTDEQNQNPN